MRVVLVLPDHRGASLVGAGSLALPVAATMLRKVGLCILLHIGSEQGRALALALHVVGLLVLGVVVGLLVLASLVLLQVLLLLRGWVVLASDEGHLARAGLSRVGLSGEGRFGLLRGCCCDLVGIAHAWG